jgi:2,3-bisphosphoglycerate-independent phosphoglycerate mutase
MSARTTTLLIVLDGWGHRDESGANAIEAARTPNWDHLLASSPNTLVSGSGMDVGLPDGQMGNSEVGHMNLGAGRVLYQDLTRIAKAIKDGDFFFNPVLCDAVDAAIAMGGAVHLMGLLSPGGVHSHEDHFAAMVTLAAQRGAKEIYVHAFLDGRDMPPRSAEPSLRQLDTLLRESGLGRIASISGRFFAMDRDNRWDRVERAWQLLTAADAPFHAADPLAGLAAAYARGENDEFVQPTWIDDPDRRLSASGLPAGSIGDGDAVVFMNFRADRARQISRAFLHDDFAGFTRARRPKLARFATMTEYASDIHAPCAYAAEDLRNTLGEYLAAQGRTQLRIAETEKYAHVTFFFSGGREEPFAGEERVLIPSPKVATYDLKPEMSAREVTDELVAAIRSRRFDFIVCNYANGDMVGHTGVFDAAVKAVEVLDECLGRVCAVLAETGGQCLVTADHGNVELMHDDTTGQPHTAHTCEPVPLVYIGARAVQLLPGGVLADVAPTLLALMGITIPREMTGRVLVQGVDAPRQQA